MDPRIEKLADVMVNYSLQIKKGDLFKIEVPYQALQSGKAVYNKALENGAYPYVEIYAEDFTELFFKNASDDQLKFVSPIAQIRDRTDRCAPLCLGRQQHQVPHQYRSQTSGDGAGGTQRDQRDLLPAHRQRRNALVRDTLSEPCHGAGSR